MADELLTTAAACALLGSVHRSTLWRYYGDLREPVTSSARSAVRWPKQKLLDRQVQMKRQSFAASRARARAKRAEQLTRVA